MLKWRCFATFSQRDVQLSNYTPQIEGHPGVTALLDFQEIAPIICDGPFHCLVIFGYLSLAGLYHVSLTPLTAKNRTNQRNS